VVPMSEYSEKVATREGAMALRVRLLNYLAEGAERIALDFAGVGLISSSFADETIGRLVEHFGITEFRKLFSLRNASPTHQVLVDRAIEARRAPD
ncbi:MAG: STAS-like domain-containing protein, partial [Gaiellaceae bacterium]